MAESYRGLTIRIGGDTSTLQKALKAANQSASQTQAELRKIGQSLKLDPSSVEAANMQMGYLAHQAANTAMKLTQLKQAQEQLKDSSVTVGFVEGDEGGLEAVKEKLSSIIDEQKQKEGLLGDEILNVERLHASANAEARAYTKSLAQAHTEVTKLAAAAAKIEHMKLKDAFDLSVGVTSMEKLEKKYAGLTNPNGKAFDDGQVDAMLKKVDELKGKIGEAYDVDAATFDSKALTKVIQQFAKDLPAGVSMSKQAIKELVGSVVNYGTEHSAAFEKAAAATQKNTERVQKLKEQQKELTQKRDEIASSIESTKAEADAKAQKLMNEALEEGEERLKAAKAGYDADSEAMKRAAEVAKELAAAERELTDRQIELSKARSNVDSEQVIHELTKKSISPDDFKDTEVTIGDVTTLAKEAVAELVKLQKVSAENKGKDIELIDESELEVIRAMHKELSALQVEYADLATSKYFESEKVKEEIKKASEVGDEALIKQLEAKIRTLKEEQEDLHDVSYEFLTQSFESEKIDQARVDEIRLENATKLRKAYEDALMLAGSSGNDRAGGTLRKALEDEIAAAKKLLDSYRDYYSTTISATRRQKDEAEKVADAELFDKLEQKIKDLNASRDIITEPIRGYIKKLETELKSYYALLDASKRKDSEGNLEYSGDSMVAIYDEIKKKKAEAEAERKKENREIAKTTKALEAQGKSEDEITQAVAKRVAKVEQLTAKINDYKSDLSSISGSGAFAKDAFSRNYDLYSEETGKKSKAAAEAQERVNEKVAESEKRVKAAQDECADAAARMAEAQQKVNELREKSAKAQAEVDSESPIDSARYKTQQALTVAALKGDQERAAALKQVASAEEELDKVEQRRAKNAQQLESARNAESRAMLKQMKLYAKPFGDNFEALTSEVFTFSGGNDSVAKIRSVLTNIAKDIGMSDAEMQTFVRDLNRMSEGFLQADTDVKKWKAALRFQDLIVELQKGKAQLVDFSKVLSEMSLPSDLTRGMEELTTNVEVLTDAYKRLMSVGNTELSSFSSNPDDTKSLEIAMEAFSAAEMVAFKNASLLESKLGEFEKIGVDKLAEGIESIDQELFETAKAAEEAHKKLAEYEGELAHIATRKSELEATRGISFTDSEVKGKHSKDIAEAENLLEDEERYTELMLKAREEARRADESLEIAREVKEYQELTNEIRENRRAILEVADAKATAMKSAAIGEAFGSFDAVDGMSNALSNAVSRAESFSKALNDIPQSTDAMEQGILSYNNAVSISGRLVEQLRQKMSGYDSSEVADMKSKYDSLDEAVAQTTKTYKSYQESVRDAEAELGKMLAANDMADERENVLALVDAMHSSMSPEIRECAQNLLRMRDEADAASTEMQAAARAQTYEGLTEQLAQAEAQLRQNVKAATEFSAAIDVKNAFGTVEQGLSDLNVNMTAAKNSADVFIKALEHDPKNLDLMGAAFLHLDEAIDAATKSSQTMREAMDTIDPEVVVRLRNNYDSLTDAVTKTTERANTLGVELATARAALATKVSDNMFNDIRDDIMDVSVSWDAVMSKMKESGIVEVVDTEAIKQMRENIIQLAHDLEGAFANMSEAVKAEQFERFEQRAMKVGETLRELNAKKEKLSAGQILGDSSDELDKLVNRMGGLKTDVEISDMSSTAKGMEDLFDKLKNVDDAMKSVNDRIKSLREESKLDPSSVEKQEAVTEALAERTKLAAERASTLKQIYDNFEAAGIQQAAPESGSIDMSLNESKAAVEEAKSGLSELSGKVKELQDKARELKSEISSADTTEKANAARQKLEEVEAELDSVESEVAEATSKFNAMNDAYDSAKAAAEMRQVADSMRAMTDEAKENAQTIDEFAKNVTSAENSVKILGESAVKSAFGSMLTEVDEIDSALKALESQIKKVNEALKSKPKDVELLDMRDSLLDEAFGLVEQKVTLINSKLNSMDTSAIDELVTKYGSASVAVEKTRAELLKTENALNVLNDALRQYAKENNQTPKWIEGVKKGEIALEGLEPEIVAVIKKIRELGDIEIGQRLEHSLASVGQKIDELGIDADTAFERLEESSKNTTITPKVDKAAFQQAVQEMGQLAERAGRQVIESSNTIDSAYRDMRKTVQGTEEQFKSLKDAAVDFSQTHVTSADTLLEMEALGGQLGVTADALGEFGEVTSNLDIATDISADEIALQLGQITNVMSDLDETTFDNFADALVRLGNNMAAQESSIMNVAQRMSSVANVAQFGTPELLAWASAIASTGQRSESAATAVNNTIIGISEAVAKGGADLKGFASIAGMTSEEFKNSWSSAPSDTLKAFVEGLQSLSETNTGAITALENMGISSVRQETALLGLASTVENLDNAMLMSKDAFNGVSDQWGDAGDAAIEAQKKSEGFSGALGILQNNANNLAASLGDGLVGPMNALSGLLSVLADVLDAMPMPLKTIVVSLGGLGAVFGTVYPSVHQFAEGWKKIREEGGSVARALDKVEDGFSSFMQMMRRSTGGLSDADAGMKKVGSSAKVASDGVSKASTAAKGAGDAMAEAASGAAAAKSGMSGASSAATGAKTALDGVTTGTAGVQAGMTGAAGATGVFSAALNAIPGMALITGLTLAIGALASVIGNAYEKAQKLRDAKERLATASDRLAEAARGATGAESEVANSIQTVGDKTSDTIEELDAMAQRQEQLAASMEDRNASYEAQASVVEKAREAIDQYVGVAGLSIDQQAELIGAVQMLNQELGSTYEVVDAANGVIRQQGSDVDATKNSIDAYISKQLEMAKSEALIQNLEDAYKELWTAENEAKEAEDEMRAAADAVAEAKSRQAEIVKDSGDAVAYSTYNMTQYTDQQAAAARQTAALVKAEKDATDAYNEKKGVVDNIKSSAASLEGQYRELQYAVVNSSAEEADAIAKVAYSMDWFASSFTGNETVDEFARQIQSLGATTDSFSKLTRNQLVTIAAAYDGSIESIQAALKKLNITFDESLASSAAQQTTVDYTELAKDKKKELQDQYDDEKRQADDAYSDIQKTVNKQYSDASKASQQYLKDYKARLDEEVEAFKEATDKKLEELERERDAKQKLLDMEYEKYDSDIDDKIEAIEAEQDAEDAARKKKEQDEKLAELRKAVTDARSNKSKAEAQKKLNDYIEDLNAEDAKNARSLAIQKLKDQKAALKEQKTARDEELKSSYDSAVESYKSAREAELKILQETNEAKYASEQALEEARLTSMKESNDTYLENLKRDNEVYFENLKDTNDAIVEDMSEGGDELAGEIGTDIADAIVGASNAVSEYSPLLREAASMLAAAGTDPVKQMSALTKAFGQQAAIAAANGYSDQNALGYMMMATENLVKAGTDPVKQMEVLNETFGAGSSWAVARGMSDSEANTTVQQVAENLKRAGTDPVSQMRILNEAYGTDGSRAALNGFVSGDVTAAMGEYAAAMAEAGTKPLEGMDDKAEAEASKIGPAGASGVAKTGNQFVKELAYLGNTLVKTMDIEDAMNGSGLNAVIGFAKGFFSHATQVFQDIINWAVDIVTGVRHTFDERSPSHVFEDIGEMLLRGFDLGWGHGVDGSVRMVERTANDLTDAFDFNAAAPDMAQAMIDQMHSKERALLEQTQRMSDIIERGFDPQLTVDAAYEAIGRIDTGRLRRQQQVASSQSVDNSTYAPSITINIPEVVVREEADIDKLSKQIALRVQRTLNARIG